MPRGLESRRPAVRCLRLWACFGLILLSGCGAKENSGSGRPQLALFAAASTREAVEQISRDFEAERGIRVKVVLGASSALVRQIEQTEEADLFLPADQTSADYLQSKGLVARRQNLLNNRLVVI